MTNIFPVFIVCLLLNLLIGYVLIIMNFKPNKKRGIYGEKGPEGINGIRGNKGNIGNRFKLDNCTKIKKFATEVKNVMIVNNEINQPCVDKIKVNISDIYNKNKNSFDLLNF